MPDTTAFSRLRKRFPEPAEQHSRQPPRDFMRMLKGHYPEGWQQWRGIRRLRMLSDQHWRLVGGPCAGCQVYLTQQGLHRQIRILCPCEQMACVLQDVKPLIEAACAGPWIEVNVTIEVESESTP